MVSRSEQKMKCNLTNNVEIFVTMLRPEFSRYNSRTKSGPKAIYCGPAPLSAPTISPLHVSAPIKFIPENRDLSPLLSAPHSKPLMSSAPRSLFGPSERNSTPLPNYVIMSFRAEQMWALRDVGWKVANGQYWHLSIIIDMVECNR